MRKTTFTVVSFRIIQTLTLWFAALLLFSVSCPVDSTDKDRWNRSGLRLHVDHETRCEYVSSIFGGPTPRLDKNGSQICRTED